MNPSYFNVVNKETDVKPVMVSHFFNRYGVCFADTTAASIRALHVILPGFGVLLFRNVKAYISRYVIQECTQTGKLLTITVPRQHEYFV